MKKSVSLFAVLAIVLCLFSCKNSSSTSPSGVAEAFTKAMLTQDFVSAKKYVVSASAGMLDQMAVFAKQMKMPDSIQQIINKATVKASNEKITDSTATVDITVTLAKAIMGQSENKQTLNLKKENNEWKVDLGSPDMLPPAGSESDSSAAQQPSQYPQDSSLKSLPTTPDSSEK